MLLLLEVIILIIFLRVITIQFSSAPRSVSSLRFGLFILVLGAIEASLGLSMAVIITRNSKVDRIRSKKMVIF